jgi:hypothetical protein
LKTKLKTPNSSSSWFLPGWIMWLWDFKCQAYSWLQILLLGCCLCWALINLELALGHARIFCTLKNGCGWLVPGCGCVWYSWQSKIGWHMFSHWCRSWLSLNCNHPSRMPIPWLAISRLVS